MNVMPTSRTTRLNRGTVPGKKSLNYDSLEMKNIAKDGFRENNLLIR